MAPSQSRLTALPDQLLDEIFLRLPTPEDLARATVACVSFTRYLTDRGFLARFRRRHAPPLLGFLDPAGLHPVSSPAAAAALAFPGADFTFSFLPSHCIWTALDTRDGRVLLGPTSELVPNLHASDIRARNPYWGFQHHQQELPPPVSTELVVADPMHRCHVLIPPVPDSISQGVISEWMTPFLLPPTEEEEAAAFAEGGGPTAFRVMWLAHNEETLSGFIFSSRTGQWQKCVSKRWEEFGLDDMFTEELIEEGPYLRRHYAYGCVYWKLMFTDCRMVLTKLDTRIMDFSIHDIVLARVTREEMQDVAIVEAGDGKLGMFAMPMSDDESSGMSELRYFVRRDIDERSGLWHLEKTIPLGSGKLQSVEAATERFLLLERGIGWPEDAPPPAEMGYYSLDVKTFKLEKVYGLHPNSNVTRLIYTNFPPTLLSSPTL